jgi:hypothetical protein
MPRILGALPAALIAARGGLSANAFARELQAQGFGARRSEVLELFKVAKGIVTRTQEEPFRPLNQTPLQSEIGTWPTKGATGIVQTVSLAYRDRTTGSIKQTWWRNTSQNGITREEAIAAAIDAYSEHAESYEQDLIGAVHTSAYNLSPFVSIQ